VGYCNVAGNDWLEFVNVLSDTAVAARWGRDDLHTWVAARAQRRTQR
jgi:hypothetical protein